MTQPNIPQGAVALAIALTLGACPLAQAQGAAAVPDAASAPASAAAASAPVRNSDLRGPLLYQLLLAEFARQENQVDDSVELLLDAARHTKDESLFRRAIEVAADAGAGDKAVAIAKAWRQALPRSTEAVRTQLQFLFALDRVGETAEPLRALLAMSSGADRSALIANLPRVAQRAKDKAGAAAQFQQLLTPYLDAPETRTAARVALGRMRLAEGKPAAALDLARSAQAQDPKAIGPVLLALDLMNAPAAKPAPASESDAESVVRRYLAGAEPEPIVRQAYASVLTSQQRIAEAAAQMSLAAQALPHQAGLWLSLGELELELHHTAVAEEALHKALALTEAEAAAEPKSAAADADAGEGSARPGRIFLMLARAAEQRHDDEATARWLARIEGADADLPVYAMRAALLARKGQLAQARALLHDAPADTPAAQRLRVMAEAQLLREAHQDGEARKVLADASAQSPTDVDLLYEQAMVDEHLNQLDEMEALLRKVIALQPDHAQAMNALGYSLADRGLRLEEARQLVQKAHDLTPADPYIIDSLGWVEFRLGRLAEAARWLRQAYQSRNDTEIAAHLGEVLWMQGQKDEGLKVWNEALAREPGNEALLSTMKRVQAGH